MRYIYENDSTLTDNGVQYFQVGDQTVGVIGLTTQFIPHWEQPEHIQSLTFHSAFLKHFNNTYLK